MNRIMRVVILYMGSWVISMSTVGCGDSGFSLQEMGKRMDQSIKDETISDVSLVDQAAMEKSIESIEASLSEVNGLLDDLVDDDGNFITRSKGQSRHRSSQQSGDLTAQSSQQGNLSPSFFFPALDNIITRTMERGFNKLEETFVRAKQEVGDGFEKIRVEKQNLNAGSVNYQANMNQLNNLESRLLNFETSINNQIDRLNERIDYVLDSLNRLENKLFRQSALLHFGVSFFIDPVKQKFINFQHKFIHIRNS